jgi:hypothetical protein
MTMHSFHRVNPTGRLLLQTLQQYCHQRPVWISCKAGWPFSELSSIATALALRRGRPYDASSGPFVPQLPCNGSFL